MHQIRWLNQIHRPVLQQQKLLEQVQVPEPIRFSKVRVEFDQPELHRPREHKAHKAHKEHPVHRVYDLPVSRFRDRNHPALLQLEEAHQNL